MQSRISEEVIDKIRQSHDIVELISDYVPLKKQGRNYVGLCPFHGEKTPSFTVSPEKQLYHCFGCRAGGNIITFVMEIEGMSFIEALRFLAEKANLEVPELDPKDQPKASLTEQLLKGYELARTYYQHVLMKTELGKEARAYLKERGFTKEMIETFQIGYAPDLWDGLTSLFLKKNVNIKMMEESGLLSKREFDGKLFDRFRKRIMFPIWNGRGQVIAFGGRIVGEGQPKYLNSPETKLFQKGKTIYGLHLARPEMRKLNEAVLFEGYVDVIAAWKAGVKNGIATLGTALTEEQAKTIRRNCEQVVICFDSDEAGISATLRAAETLEQAGCYVKVAMLPEGYDPDEYIQQYGKDAFREQIIAKSATLIRFKMQILRKNKNLDNESDKLLYINEVLNEIAKLKKTVERDHYLRQLADEFSLSLEALKQEFYQIYRKQQRKERHYEKREKEKRNNVLAIRNKLLPAYENAERYLLAYMMKDNHICKIVEERIGPSFNGKAYQAIAAHLYAYYSEGNHPDVSKFIHRLPDENLQRIAAEIAMLQLKGEITKEELDDYMSEIEKRTKWVEIEQKEHSLAEITDPIEYAKLKNEIIQLKRQLKR